MRILSVCSARPNFVKLAAVHHAIAKNGKHTHVIVHTGQHYDPLLSDIFFEQLQISQPDFNLGVKGASDRESVIQATADAMVPVLEKVKPEIVLVYGDVNGAVGAARAAKQLGIKIGHVEAGLRSGDRTMPEELNRIDIDQIAELLFTTEKSAEKNIEKEGLKGKVCFVGNTMIDTLIRMMPLIDIAELPFDPPSHYAVATLHRPSNVDNQEYLLNVVHFLGRVDKIIPIILPMHPRFRDMVTKPIPESSEVPLLVLRYPIDPLGYLPFLKLLKSAKFVLTDSGGIQEEAAFLKKRCFTLRRNTERPSTIDCGSNMLIDPDNETDRKKVLDFSQKPETVQIADIPLWDGHAGERILAELLKLS